MREKIFERFWEKNEEKILSQNKGKFFFLFWGKNEGKMSLKKSPTFMGFKLREKIPKKKIFWVKMREKFFFNFEETNFRKILRKIEEKIFYFCKQKDQDSFQTIADSKRTLGRNWFWFSFDHLRESKIPRNRKKFQSNFRPEFPPLLRVDFRKKLKFCQRQLIPGEWCKAQKWGPKRKLSEKRPKIHW